MIEKFDVCVSNDMLASGRRLSLVFYLFLHGPKFVLTQYTARLEEKFVPSALLEIDS